MPKPEDIVDFLRQSVVDSTPEKLNKIIEVGCGEGDVLKMLLEKNPTFLLGIDVKDDGVRLKGKETKCNIVVGNIGWLPIKDKTFDVAICVNVYGELNEIEAKNGVLELLRIVKTSGKIMIGIKNIFNPLLAIRTFLLKRKTNTKRPILFSLYFLEKLIKKGGGKIYKIIPISPYPLYYPKNWLWCKIRRFFSILYFYTVSSHPRFAPLYNVFAERET